ncbi:MAG: signal recognition particle-docking protein FtsY [bacterium TMED217]|nr:MAG: signal recognition particle-docking protein FtsY [bacterium TMED217]
MLSKLFNALENTRTSINQAFKKLKSENLLEEDIEGFEEQLLLADIGYDTVDGIITILKKLNKEDYIDKIREYLVNELPKKYTMENFESPIVIMMVGVNGTGKTTSSAKLAKIYKEQGKKVLLIAADTYRAAAIEQLEIWSNRAGVRLVYNNQTKEPSAVLFDGLNSARSDNYEVVIVDTAGRLHTYDNLMAELEKMYRIIDNRFPEFLVKNLITIDSLLGQNSVVQAKQFNKHIPIDGAILTKFDGTAKGGIIFPLYKQLGVSVKFIGTGEEISDIEFFDPQIYLDGLLGNEY